MRARPTPPACYLATHLATSSITPLLVRSFPLLLPCFIHHPSFFFLLSLSLSPLLFFQQPFATSTRRSPTSQSTLDSPTLIYIFTSREYLGPIRRVASERATHPRTRVPPPFPAPETLAHCPPRPNVRARGVGASRPARIAANGVRSAAPTPGHRHHRHARRRRRQLPASPVCLALPCLAAACLAACRLYVLARADTTLLVLPPHHRYTLQHSHLPASPFTHTLSLYLSFVVHVARPCRIFVSIPVPGPTSVSTSRCYSTSGSSSLTHAPPRSRRRRPSSPTPSATFTRWHCIALAPPRSVLATPPPAPFGHPPRHLP